ncbi:sigma 54-interacting transcriptional regulator [Salinispira pacifica]|uniref:Nitrogenase (Molybdenum-iron)-specific transcriptional regulator NifA n=1 Tax=Salinispira pacifica TaxID=1307761 RepID=V5WHR4_9SPIO|nr:sigma 54-interacting transcriptional regulator [Salinispira pacifica]AHC14711.1 Nitrogenase (molybdenum-iron)-specific transcriptional regulator NifA [Salinispira pacifica]
MSESPEQQLEELSLLFSISQILDQSLDIKQVVDPVLEAVGEEFGMLRGTISLLDTNTEEIFIESAYGLSDQEIEKGQYQLGEGITGKVVESGIPQIIPKISDSLEFLNRTGARAQTPEQEHAFLCVPIKLGNTTIGAFSVDIPSPENDTILEQRTRLLSIIASMLAQAVKIRRDVMEEKRVLMEENQRLQDELRDRFKPANIIGNSKSMQNVFDMIAQVSRSDATVLIRGESGTGKELVAHAIHYNSHRSGKPFVKVNCAALPETVIESELFGHEKGAFTSAIATRKGRFEMANGGTIFLDEIGDLSPTTQVKLLRVLQEKEFERVGGNDTIRTNVRVIAATNRNLEDLMNQNIFREDLYYRLNVFPVHIPPLRDRKSDILLLADHFIAKYNKQNMKTVRRISTPAIELLTNYHWPGNVRELENCVERAVLLSIDNVIHSHHLPPSLQSAESTGTRLNEGLQEALDSLERELLQDALKSTKGNMAKAARLLDLTERKMGLRVKKHNVDPRIYR